MAPTLLGEQEIRDLIGPAEALAAVKEAFAALAREHAETPAVIIIEIPESRGEVHVKGAHLGGSPYYAVKFASVFEDNPALGCLWLAGSCWPSMPRRLPGGCTARERIPDRSADGGRGRVGGGPAGEAGDRTGRDHRHGRPGSLPA